MTRVDKDRKIRPILSDHEFDLLLAQARVFPFNFLAMRNVAILCMIRVTGKRRKEIASVTRRDVYLEKPNLAINFKLLKKSHRKTLPDGTVIPAGPPPDKVRYIPFKDPLSQPIILYKAYIDKHFKDSTEFWLHVRPVFGNYVIYPDKGIQGRQIYNVVRDAGDLAGVTVWPHLFRESAGAEEIRKDPTPMGMRKVMRRIDVSERTAWNYVERYVDSVIEREYEEEEEQND